MTYKELLSQYGFSNRAYQLLFSISSKIKDITSYQNLKNDVIDFKVEEFRMYMNSLRNFERDLRIVYFYKHEFILLKQVFCPRNETELVVEVAVEEIKKLSDKEISYVDLCSGTGNIGCSVLMECPHIKTSLVEKDINAVENINLNLEKFGLSGEVDVFYECWREHLKSHRYKVITANFPYIGVTDEIDELEDPSESLFAPNSGFQHYKDLTSKLKRDDVWEIVILECSAYHESIWEELTKTLPWKIKMIYDYSNRFRVVLITRQ